MWINGERIHQVGLPYHWGYKGKAKGDVVNDLLAISEEPNVRIMETKALMCSVMSGRRARGTDGSSVPSEQGQDSLTAPDSVRAGQPSRLSHMVRGD